jgi:hypothetical protein
MSSDDEGTMKLDIDALKMQISLLFDQNPELAEDEDLRADMLEGSTDLHDILSKLVGREREAAEIVEAIKSRIDKIAERRNRFKDRQQALRSVILSIMQRAELRKLELAEATISVAKTGRAVQVLDEDQIPDGFFKTKRELSKTLLKEALNAGETVPGAVLDNGDVTVRIS